MNYVHSSGNRWCTSTNAAWQSWIHFKHEQPTQESIAEWPKVTCTWEVTQNGYSSGYSMQMSQYPIGSSAFNRLGTLLKCYNLPQKNDRQSQLSTQLYVYILSKSTFLIFRRWSFSLPYILYPIWSISLWFTPCIIKQNILVQSSNMHFTINQINQINSIASNNNKHLPEDQYTVH